MHLAIKHGNIFIYLSIFLSISDLLNISFSVDDFLCSMLRSTFFSYHIYGNIIAGR